MAIKISILMATFNSESTLSASLDSLIQQTLQDWECIVSDGGSKDRTLDILREYSTKDSRISYKSEKDRGIYDALNKSLLCASGEWIYVLGSDDKVTKNGLNLLYEASTPDAGVVYGDIYAVFGDGNKEYIVAKPPKTMTYIMAPSHQGMIMRRDLMKKQNGFNIKYRIRGDFDLTQRVYLTGSPFIHINVPVAEVLQTGISCTDTSYKTHLERYEIMKANKSTRFPFLMFWFVEIRGIIKRIFPEIFSLAKKILGNR